MQHSIVWILLANTAVATAIALLAWMAGRLRCPAIAHVLWVLVILKLLSPPLWRVEVWTASGNGPAPARLERSPVAAAFPRQSPAPQPPKIVAGSLEDRATFNSSRRSPLSPTLSPEYRGEGEATVARLLFSGLMAGAIAYLTIVLLRLVRFRRSLRDSVPADEALFGEVVALAGQIGLARPPAVRVVNLVCSPMIFFLGVGRPRLILPASLVRQLDREQRAAVIAHELAHLKRCDHWVRMLEIAATALLWWHPLLWVARLGLRDAEEQCCDAWVVALLPHARRRYADALVDAVQFLSRGPAPVGATGLGRLGHLRRRLTMIVTSGSMPSKSLSRVGRALVAACLIILPLAPVRGEAPPSAATQPATVTAAENDAARRAVQALLAAARDPNQEVQQAAMQAVARFGPAAIPTLVDSLDMSPSGDMAVSLLASLGEQAVDPLLKTLESKDPARRLRALQAIDGMITQQVQMGYGMPGFGFGGTVGGEMMGMEGAGGMLPPGGAPGGEGAPPEVKKLASRVCGPVANRAGDEDASVRLQAVTMLGRLSSLCAEESIAKATVRALNDQSVEVRRAAAVTMVNLGGAAREEALEALTTAVKDDDEQVRVAALDALGAMGPGAKGASEVIIGALKDPQPRVRVAAARALGAMQPLPEPPPVPGGMAPHGGGFGEPQ